ncbi:MAG TPA: FKBP-type peptidyl-prolyl cis-trans isomerase [Pyrinomonadaceae bacterium]|nr:FKBP-type peptidyl-prolyl cis-trans isomerase [Pyrinomonadaceae bacterium]
MISDSSLGPYTLTRATRIFGGFLILAALLGGGYLACRRGAATIETASGLKYSDLKVGDGATPRLGQSVQVHYVGWLSNGKEFNNSYKLGTAPEFRLGPSLIPGWNEALQSMKVGGKRRVIVPPNLAYGQTGRPPTIPPNETLTFEIELLAVK